MVIQAHSRYLDRIRCSIKIFDILIWKNLLIDFFGRNFDLLWPWMTIDDLLWPFVSLLNRLSSKKLHICYEYSGKLTITIWNFDHNYYVIRSRDRKMDTCIELFRFEISQTDLEMNSPPSSLSEKSRNRFFDSILGNC